jgi:CyaY protein
MQELWVAARSGGFHYKHIEGQWRNTRDGSELFAALSDITTQQGGAPVVISVQ